ncbi:MAG: DNA repair protein RadA [Bacteroidales bacterium]|nr:DNA repair protein RadA [Bacteroidales bacterium]MDD4361599.1 DNA repair protein RadA [Bacteroidales bacterium]MDD4430588.1 DNA repair protein RadA [Bacteroidales bacterium]
MAKAKTIFLCSNCGSDFPKWMGKCPVCGEWGSINEEVIHRDTTSKQLHPQFSAEKSKALLLSEVESTQEARIGTGGPELDRVLGGGLVQGSMVLLGGEPGIGKSTLVLQTAIKMTHKRILYVSGEESLQQIKMRAERIKGENPQAYFLAETSLENIFEQIIQIKPELLIIDSIQTLSTEVADSSPGSVTQVRECATALLKVAKTLGMPIILIGHINKEGSLAGPKVLEHIVDTVLLFEGDTHHFYRILRSVKNRFGSIAEIGMYEMRSDGLREVTNPSELLLSQHQDGLSGVAIAAAIEGIRPFLIETQALVSTAAYGTPQRSTTGFDLRRLNMLLAVLEKRAGFKIAQKDVFLNIAGGIRVNDPAIDLSVIAAILSSNLNLSIGNKICLAGEVGLAGEIRPVNRLEQRIMEAQKLGFEQIIVPDFAESGTDLRRFKIRIDKVRKVEESFRLLFG